jgi:hypothetical protein
MGIFAILVVLNAESYYSLVDVAALTNPSGLAMMRWR